MRQSWAAQDARAAALSLRELSELFPDLLAKSMASGDDAPVPVNCYQALDISAQNAHQAVIAAYMRKVRKFLQKLRLSGESLTKCQEEYWRILNAGFILRKPRLRVSHDLMAARRWLLDVNAITADGRIVQTRAEEVEKPTKLEPALAQPEPVILIVEMLKQARFIGEAEEQALKAQMARAPEIPIERLILDSGYVSRQEMNSLKLAETLLLQEKINMAQFQVAMYDERNSGVRFAESLQVRGWLPVEVNKPSDETNK